MKIKTFSECVGVSMDTIRYYEKIGLLHPLRLDNGYRHYDENCVAEIKMIVVLKHLGFSLQEISQLTVLKKKEVTPECNEAAKFLFEKKIKQLTKKITFYIKSLDTLKMAKDLMESHQQYENNKEDIEHAINMLFNELKEGGFNG